MKKLFLHPLAVVLITLICFLIFFSLKKTSQKATISNKNIQVLEQEIEQLEQFIISNQNKLYQSEQKFAKEKILRDQLLMQKDGEIIIQLPIEDLEVEKKDKKLAVSPLEEWQKLWMWRTVK